LTEVLRHHQAFLLKGSEITAQSLLTPEPDYIAADLSIAPKLPLQACGGPYIIGLLGNE